MKTYSFLIKTISYFVPYRIEQRNGKITRYLEVVLDNGKLVLNTSDVNYSYGSLHDLFFLTFKKINLQDRKIKNALILGFGAGSVATLLRDTFDKDCKITGVEADEVMIELAKKHFNIDRFNNLTLHIMDAYNYVLKCTEQFDLIILDLFIDDRTPALFSDERFISALGKLLSHSGIICYNRMVTDEKPRNQAEELMKSMELNIGPCFYFQYRSGNSVNWMIIHDKASSEIRHSFEGFTQGSKLQLN